MTLVNESTCVSRDERSVWTEGEGVCLSSRARIEIGLDHALLVAIGDVMSVRSEILLARDIVYSSLIVFCD